MVVGRFHAAYRAWQVGIDPEVTFTGGVAKNIGMVTTLNEMLGFSVNVSEDSHYMGALGAALFAMDRILSGRVPLTGNST